MDITGESCIKKIDRNPFWNGAKNLQNLSQLELLTWPRSTVWVHVWGRRESWSWTASRCWGRRGMRGAGASCPRARGPATAWGAGAPASRGGWPPPGQPSGWGCRDAPTTPWAQSLDSCPLLGNKDRHIWRGRTDNTIENSSWQCH